MATTSSPGRQAILDTALDIFRMRQYFDVVVRARDMAAALRKDTTFLRAVRRGLLPFRLTGGLPPGTSSGHCPAPRPRR